MSFKIAVIGCGHMATEGHGPSYRKYASIHSDVELAACCDKNETAAAQYQMKFGFSRRYTDWEEMLDSESPDAVSLVVPVHLTAELFIRICEKGFPVLTEKPPGMNRTEALRMIEAAERFGVPNQAAFNRRHMPLVNKMKQLLSATLDPSDIHHIRYDLSRVNRKDADFSTTAIHGIDTVKHLLGSDYGHVRFRYQDVGEPGSDIVNIYMDCTFESGATAQLNFCPISGGVIERATVHGRGHSYHMHLPVWGSPDLPGRLIHMHNNEVLADLSGSDITDGEELFETNGFYAENASFFDDIRAGRRPVDDIRSGLQSVEIADCIRRRLEEYAP